METEQPRRLRRWVVAFFLLALGGAASDYTRWWIFDGRVNATLCRPLENPTVQDLAAFRGLIDREATAAWIKPSSLDVSMRLEQMLSNGYALKEDQTKLYWFLIVEARSGLHDAKWRGRIDNDLAEREAEALEAAGIHVVKPATQGG